MGRAYLFLPFRKNQKAGQAIAHPAHCYAIFNCAGSSESARLPEICDHLPCQLCFGLTSG
nr:MAG TPA: hypothetical protein [Caudoviricetes sp.]